MRTRIIVLSLALCCIAQILNGQDKTYQKIDSKKWEEAVKDTDFNETTKKKEQPEENKPTTSPFSIGLPSLGLGQAFMWIVIVLLAGLVVYMVIKNFYQPQNTKVKSIKTDFKVSTINEELPRSELERLLERALSSQDYKAAVRIYYLMVIQALSKKKLILWKKDKTNGEYVREMYGKPHADTFKDVTLTFDRIWYGGMDVNEHWYQEVGPQFQGLLESISKPIVN